MEIFDIEQWKLILNAVYIMSARAEVIGAVNAVMTDILERATILLTIMANVEVDHEKIVLNGPGACKNSELYPEVTVTFQNKQVFYSEEEVERIKQEEYERKKREEKTKHEAELKARVGGFRNELRELFSDESKWNAKESMPSFQPISQIILWLVWFWI